MDSIINRGYEIARQHSNEVEAGDRFEFGKNWLRFLDNLDEDRIIQAERSLCEMLGSTNLEGARFLDIGSGSGLFSLAAKRLGAKVFSFDFDTNSVKCTSELRSRYQEDDGNWQVEQGSALDTEYIESLGKFDYVYSWGVLHHTGEMWLGLENASLAVKEGGKLFIAIYNDTGSQANRWKWIKKTYCSLPEVAKKPFALAVILPEELKRFGGYAVKGKPLKYIDYLREYSNDRGMDRWRDVIDWVGGYPYEVATPDEIFEFYSSKGYRLTKLKCGSVGLGCNEYVFRKTKN